MADFTFPVKAVKCMPYAKRNAKITVINASKPETVKLWPKAVKNVGLLKTCV